MVTPKCERCGKIIPAANINVAQNVAHCAHCNLAYVLSELAEEGPDHQAVDLAHPPRGCWYLPTVGGAGIVALHRDLLKTLPLLLVTLFWNGITSIFVMINLAATLRHLGFHLAAWFPAPKGGFGSSLGEILFLWLFLTPFILVGLGLATMFLTTVFGRTVIQIRGGDGVIDCGIGPLSWRRRFETARVRRIRRVKERNRNSSSERVVLEMDNGRKIKLGSLLSEERQAFILAALRENLRR